MGLVRLVLASLAAACLAAAVHAGPTAEQVIDTNVRLMLELARHTPTYSPPVASRAFAYVGVAAHEALVAEDGGSRSLAGQLNGLTAPPPREAGAAYDEAVVLQAALARMLGAHFANTGPTGQRAMAAMAARLGDGVAEGVPPDVVARSAAHGLAVADHVLAWGEGDGGAVVENMGFPLSWDLPAGPGAWVPTSAVVQQQLPLLPGWGSNRTFAMPEGGSCPLPDPHAYSEDPASDFHAEAVEVLAARRGLTDDQRAVARFWSDDPMLTPTPPGHWVSIARQVLEAEGADAARRAEVMAVLGVALADAFIGCWHEKFRHNTVRPVTYIRAHLDPDFQPLLTTPPFPEYPSGHSTQSGAAAAVLTHLFGDGYAFEDRTHEDDGLPARAYPSFWAAAEEAALSRLYGGIHFRAAIERGLDQGRCVAAFAVALRTRG